MKKTFVLLMTGIACLSGLTALAQVSTGSNTIASGNYVGTANNFDVVFKRNAVAAGLLATNKTSFGVNSAAMTNSTCIGVSAGQYSSGSGSSTYIGQNAGKGQSGSVLNSGNNNTYVGFSGGQNNTTGSGNVAVGAEAGLSITSGSNNTYIGSGAGFEEESTASGNVFIGHFAGFTEPGSNKLVIGNDEPEQLIWGDFALDLLKLNGKVGVGAVTAFPTTAGSVSVSAYKLFVTGGILTEEVRVTAIGTWADYVFAKDYKLPTLAEVENHINEKGHLINVPSAEEVCENGIALGEMAKIQQEKIEELTLYIIEQNKINEKQAATLEAQQKQIEDLKALVTTMLEK